MSLLKMFKALFTSAPHVSPAEGAPRVRAGDAVLVDVREPGEWSHGVAKGAALLPLSDLTGRRTQWQPFLQANAGKELLVYCAAGGRSGLAAKLLVNDGHRAANAGSFSRWAASGWPIARPDGRRS